MTAQTTAVSQTPRILPHNKVWSDAFVAWWGQRTPQLIGNPEMMVEQGNVLPGAWKEFIKSEYVPSSNGQSQSIPKPQPSIAPVPTPQAPIEPSVLPEITLNEPSVPAVAPVTSNGHTVHTNGASKPVSKPLVEVMPANPPVVEASNPFTDLITSELRKIGWAPERALTAEQAQSLADDAALSMAETVLAQLRADLANGRYQTRQVVDIRVNGQTIREVEGKAPVWFPRLLKLAKCRVPALMVGPAGCGKTTSAEMVAKALGLPFYRISMAAGVDEGTLQGWLHPKEQMNFTYVASMCSDAYEHGGVVLIDDMDLSNANMLGIANAILDDSDWFIALRHDKPMFTRHPDFIVIAAANTAGHGADGQYVGANQLDERTLSRFRLGQIRCDYDESLEQDRFDTEVVSFGQMLRARCRATAGMDRDVSTRDMASVQKLTAAMSLDEAWYGYFVDWTEEECTQVHASVNHTDQTAILN